MSARFARNTIAVLMVILWVGLMLIIGGCTTIKMERETNEQGYSEKITVRAPPKDFKALDFQWYDTRLKAGEAATADQWADVVSDSVGIISPCEINRELLLNASAYCQAYPAMCAGN